MLQPSRLTARTVFLGSKASPFTFKQICRRCGQIPQSLSRLSINPFSTRHLAHPCEQLQISAKIEGVDFGAEASFFSTLSS